MDFVDSLLRKKYELDIVNGEAQTSLSLGDYFILLNLRKELSDSLARNDVESFRLVIGRIIKLQIKRDIPKLNLNKILRSVITIIKENHVRADVVFMTPPPKDDKNKDDKIEAPVRWDFSGRALAMWIDSFARIYHWDLDKILSLPIDTAAYLYQELLVQNQYAKEWDYGLTELAYPYNENSKKNEFVPLKRPYWMQDSIDGVIKTTRLRRDMLPYGIVLDLSGMGVMSASEQPIATENTEISKEIPEKE